MLTEEEFTCGMCQGTFTKSRSDDEAEAEKTALWGDIPLSECAVVCGDCFEAMGLATKPE